MFCYFENLIPASFNTFFTVLDFSILSCMHNLEFSFKIGQIIQKNICTGKILHAQSKFTFVHVKPLKSSTASLLYVAISWLSHKKQLQFESN